MNRLAIPVLAACALLAPAATAGDWSLSGSVGVESRSFWEDARDDTAFAGTQLALELAPEWRFTSAERKHRLVLAPYLRVDSTDDERSLFDLREAYWQRIGSDWELSLGLRRVFWGVAESRHLVDVVNSPDLAFDLDGEDRLGQPMVAFTLLRDWGTLDLMLLPGFREPTTAGRDGRLRPPLPIEEADDDWGRMGAALRWSQVLGEVDLGLSLFHGPDREARLSPAAGGDKLERRHDDVSRLGLDLQWTRGAWLWKLEALWRTGNGDAFAAAVGGFEWTAHGLGGSAVDLGVIFELHRDGRDLNDAPPTLFDDELFAGLRLALNDTQGTAILAGALVDPDTRATSVLVEAERRIGSHQKLSLELRLVADAADDPALAALAEDDHLVVAWSWHL